MLIGILLVKVDKFCCFYVMRIQMEGCWYICVINYLAVKRLGDSPSTNQLATDIWATCYLRT